VLCSLKMAKVQAIKHDVNYPGMRVGDTITPVGLGMRCRGRRAHALKLPFAWIIHVVLNSSTLCLTCRQAKPQSRRDFPSNCSPALGGLVDTAAGS